MGLIAAALMLAVLFVVVRASLVDRRIALDIAAASLARQAQAQEAFEQERGVLTGEVDRLLRQVAALRKQTMRQTDDLEQLRAESQRLTGMVVDLGGNPAPPSARRDPFTPAEPSSDDPDLPPDTVDQAGPPASVCSRADPPPPPSCDKDSR